MVLACFIVAAFAACSSNAPKTPALHRAIGVVPHDVRFVPNGTGAERSDFLRDISGTLKHVYTEAFIRPEPTGTTPVPTTIKATAAASWFAPGARITLAGASSPFALGRRLEVLHGRVDWDGVVTHEKGAVTAYISVVFNGTVSRMGERDTILIAHQNGTMLLKRDGTKWSVHEFDLQLKTILPPPSPTPR